MPIPEIKLRRIAYKILNNVHDCDAGMKQKIRYYRNAIAERDRMVQIREQMIIDSAPQTELDKINFVINRFNTDEIPGQFKAAVKYPYSVESKIQLAVTKDGAPTINAALSQISSQTLSTLQAELGPLKAYSDTLVNHIKIDGWTDEQIAVDIETNRLDIDRDEELPLPAEYEDVI